MNKKLTEEEKNRYRFCGDPEATVLICTDCKHRYDYIKTRKFACDAFPDGIPKTHFQKDNDGFIQRRQIPEEYTVCNNGIGFERVEG